MLQTLEVTGYAFNHLKPSSQNGFENVKLPLQEENLRFSHGFMHPKAENLVHFGF